MKNIKTFESFLAKLGGVNTSESNIIYIWNWSSYERLSKTEAWSGLLEECEERFVNIVKDCEILGTEVSYDDGLEDEEIFLWFFKIKLLSDKFVEYIDYLKSLELLDNNLKFDSINDGGTNPFETCFTGQPVLYQNKMYTIKEFKDNMFILDDNKDMIWYNYE